MSGGAILLAALLLAAEPGVGPPPPVGTQADDRTREPGRATLFELGAFAASPSALETGQLLGPSLAVRLAGPLALGARLRLGRASENDLTWSVSHTELSLAATAALVAALGRGEVGVTLSAGPLVLHEARARHQALRLESAGLERETSAWSVGISGALEAGVRLFVFETFGVALGGGPRVDVLGEDGAPRLGFSAGLAAFYELPGASR